MRQNSSRRDASYFLKLRRQVVLEEALARLLNDRPASDEVHRIVPIGLTLGEARAWYMNHVLLPQIRLGLLAIAASFILLSSMLSSLGGLLEATLVTHMVVQHLFFLAAGVLLGYGITSLILVGSRLSTKVSRAYALMLKANLAVNKFGVLTFLVAAALIAYWYMPAEFDAATVAANIHLEMHITLFLAGGLIFVGSTFFSKRVKLIAPVVVGKVIGLYGAFLVLTPITIYAAYPAYEQTEAGIVMLFIMLGLDFTIVPIWLYGYFGKNPPTHGLVDLYQN